MYYKKKYVIYLFDDNGITRIATGHNEFTAINNLFNAQQKYGIDKVKIIWIDE